MPDSCFPKNELSIASGPQTWTCGAFTAGRGRAGTFPIAAVPQWCIMCSCTLSLKCRVESCNPWSLNILKSCVRSASPLRFSLSDILVELSDDILGVFLPFLGASSQLALLAVKAWESVAILSHWRRRWCQPGNLHRSSVASPDDMDDVYGCERCQPLYDGAVFVSHSILVLYEDNNTHGTFHALDLGRGEYFELYPDQGPGYIYDPEGEPDRFHRSLQALSGGNGYLAAAMIDKGGPCCAVWHVTEPGGELDLELVCFLQVLKEPFTIDLEKRSVQICQITQAGGPKTFRYGVTAACVASSDILAVVVQAEFAGGMFIDKQETDEAARHTRAVFLQFWRMSPAAESGSENALMAEHELHKVPVIAHPVVQQLACHGGLLVVAMHVRNYSDLMENRLLVFHVASQQQIRSLVLEDAYVGDITSLDLHVYSDQGRPVSLTSASIAALLNAEHLKHTIFRDIFDDDPYWSCSECQADRRELRYDFPRPPTCDFCKWRRDLLSDHGHGAARICFRAALGGPYGYAVCDDAPFHHLLDPWFWPSEDEKELLSSDDGGPLSMSSLSGPEDGEPECLWDPFDISENGVPCMQIGRSDDDDEARVSQGDVLCVSIDIHKLIVVTRKGVCVLKLHRARGTDSERSAEVLWQCCPFHAQQLSS